MATRHLTLDFFAVRFLTIETLAATIIGGGTVADEETAALAFAIQDIAAHAKLLCEQAAEGREPSDHSEHSADLALHKLD